jgi:hypothetical protein
VLKPSVPDDCPSFVVSPSHRQTTERIWLSRLDANDLRPDDAPGKDHPQGVIDAELAAALRAADVLVRALVAEHDPTSAVPTDAPALASI